VEAYQSTKKVGVPIYAVGNLMKKETGCPVRTTITLGVVRGKNLTVRAGGEKVNGSSSMGRGGLWRNRQLKLPRIKNKIKKTEEKKLDRGDREKVFCQIHVYRTHGLRIQGRRGKLPREEALAV